MRDVIMAPSSSETRAMPSRAETGVPPVPSRAETEVVPSSVSSTVLKLEYDRIIKDLRDSIYQWAERYENGSVSDAIKRFKIVIKNPIVKLNKQEMILLNTFSSYILQNNLKTDNFFYLFNMILKPLDILYGNAGYYLPESGEQIKLFCNMFSDIFKNHIQYINKLFIVEDVFRQNSVNGKAFVINTKEPTVDVTLKNKLLVVKVALTPESDSLSYEYYIGKFLNIMRYKGITDVFALMYGRFTCDFSIDRAGDLLCTKKSEDDEKKIHIITEYVRNVSTGKSLSLYDFINKRFYFVMKYVQYFTNVSTGEKLSLANFIRKVNNKNILVDQGPVGDLKTVIYEYLVETNVIIKNIMLMILFSLKRAQELMSFTHYDLHLGNILIVEHEDARTYKTGADNFPAVKHMPHIIDYGRCYIDTSRVLEEYKLLYDKEEITYVDDNGETYTSFMQMQRRIYGGNNFISTRYESVEIMVQKYISENIKKYINVKYQKELKKKEQDIIKTLKDSEEFINEEGISRDVRENRKRVQETYKTQLYEKIYDKYRKIVYKDYRNEVYQKYVGSTKMTITNEEKREFFPNLKPDSVPNDVYQLVVTTPTKPNYQHDMFKVVMGICDNMIPSIEMISDNKILDSDICKTLSKEWFETRVYLKEEFPIFDEKYTLLFKTIDNNIKNPHDLLLNFFKVFCLSLSLMRYIEYDNLSPSKLFGPERFNFIS